MIAQETEQLPYEVQWQGEWLPVFNMWTKDQHNVLHVDNVADVITLVAYDSRLGATPWCVLDIEKAPNAMATLRKVTIQ